MTLSQSGKRLLLRKLCRVTSYRRSETVGEIMHEPGILRINVLYFSYWRLALVKFLLFRATRIVWNNWVLCNFENISHEHFVQFESSENEIFRRHESKTTAGMLNLCLLQFPFGSNSFCCTRAYWVCLCFWELVTDKSKKRKQVHVHILCFPCYLSDLLVRVLEIFLGRAALISPLNVCKFPVYLT